MRDMIYAVKVTNLCGKCPVSKMSQDTYKTFTEAARFITTRSDNPERINWHQWESKEYMYNIIILNVE